MSKSKDVPPAQDPLNDHLIGLSYHSTRLLKQAGLLSRFGYPDQAIQVARRAAEADAKDPDIRNFIARTLLTAYPNKPEAIDEALTQIGECLRLRPDDPAPCGVSPTTSSRLPSHPPPSSGSAPLCARSPIATTPISFWAWSPTHGDRTAKRSRNTRLP